MIVLKVEMWPNGNEVDVVEFGRAYIINDKNRTVSSDLKLGDYDAQFLGGVYGREDLLKKVWKKTKVLKFDRINRGAWDLIFIALKNIVGGRNL